MSTEKNTTKKRFNSRAKGKNGERELCKMLGESLGGHWMRVPSSGSMVGATNKVRLNVMSVTQGRAFRGDIIPPDHLPKMYLESKSYKDFKFHHLITDEKCTLMDTWIEQVLDGAMADDVWFICFKITLKGWYVAFPSSKKSIYSIGNHALYANQHCDVVVTGLKEFLSKNSSVVLTECA